MPRLIKNETLRRLSVSQECLSLAFSRLATPKPLGYDPEPSDWAIEIGLIGIAADLAIAAALYEMLGPSGIRRKDSGFYFTASEALAAFRKTLASRIPKTSVLTEGLPKSAIHLRKLEDACSNFAVLFTARAAAVHAGEGAAHDVVFCVGKYVADFLALLAEGSNWKPYLRNIPAIPALPKEKTLIAQELAALVKAGGQKAASALSGIFLVLPELTKSEPDWLKSLERVQVSPKANDITVLVKSLQQSSVGDLFKVGKGANAIAARIDPTNPDAIPIYAAGMKKKFDNPLDGWSAHIGLANAELEKGIFAPPPIESIYSFAANGIDQIGLPPEEIKNGLPSHSIWPFVAGALAYSGTKGPSFFLVRALKESEFGQLTALLQRASKLSNTLKKVLPNYQELYEGVVKNKLVSADSVLSKMYSRDIEIRRKARRALPQKLEDRAENADKKRQPAYQALIKEISQSDAVAPALAKVVEGTIDLGGDKIPVVRGLIEAASEKEDLATLASILINKAVPQVSTTIRKAIEEIDFSFYGPG